MQLRYELELFFEVQGQWFVADAKSWQQPQRGRQHAATEHSTAKEVDAPGQVEDGTRALGNISFGLGSLAFNTWAFCMMVPTGEQAQLHESGAHMA